MHKNSQHPVYLQDININFVFIATAFKQNTQGYLVSFQNSKKTLQRECFMIAIKGLCQYALHSVPARIRKSLWRITGFSSESSFQTKHCSRTVIFPLCKVIKMDCKAQSQDECKHFPAASQGTRVIKIPSVLATKVRRKKIHTSTPSRFSMFKQQWSGFKCCLLQGYLSEFSFHVTGPNNFLLGFTFPIYSPFWTEGSNPVLMSLFFLLLLNHRDHIWRWSHKTLSFPPSGIVPQYPTFSVLVISNKWLHSWQKQQFWVFVFLFLSNLSICINPPGKNTFIFFPSACLSLKDFMVILLQRWPRRW